MIDFGFRISDVGFAKQRSACAHSLRTPHSAFRIRTALTLIELLVVIVILTTLVGGVIPILSPNNDTRKISAAARGLQGYITVAQSKAARTGRPHGIAFRESSPGSGVALEVFGLEVPPPFAGFSTESRVRVQPRTAAPQVYNPGRQNTFKYHPALDDAQLYILNFELAGGAGAVDFLPPRTFLIGDQINIDGNEFLIVDSPGNVNLEVVGVEPNQVRYVGSAARPVTSVECVWLNSRGQVAPTGLRRYKINRQATSSSEAPYQLPSGIVIDMQGSIAEGSQNLSLQYTRFPTATSFYTDRSGIAPGNPVPTDAVGIMFSPTGAVDSLIINGTAVTNSSRIALLLGRIENGGIDPTLATYPWVFNNVNDKDELEEKQENVNWLNLDSRLVSIVPSNGRSVVSETAFVDPSLAVGANALETAWLQIQAAQTFAQEMSTVGGN